MVFGAFVWYTGIENKNKYFVFILSFLVNENEFGDYIINVRMNLRIQN